MSIEAVRRELVGRLEDGDRGDRGWFVLTRVHLALSWLRGVAEYLENRGGGQTIRLTEHDYDRLATIIDTDHESPGIQLRRHHLLVMDKPLQLLQRADGRRWDQIALTEQGRALAGTDDPATVLEQSLSAMRFAVEPWSPPNRVQQYGEFDVRVYEVTKQVLQRCDGYIDRDEFDFFVSRIRTANEVDRTTAAIAAYRALPPGEQSTLHDEVRSRVPGAKAYSNWRDVALHTFTLFSLGTSMVRDGRRLLLTRYWIREPAPPATGRGRAPQLRTSRVRDRSRPARTPQLRIPEPPELPELLTPPVAPARNDGSDAESFVAKLLRSKGWEVAFYTNRRGYGFDLWARKGSRAMVIEVKSSLGVLGTVSLTPPEYRAARQHGDNYVLALVEHMDSASPELSMIQNPVSNLEIAERLTTNYTIARHQWAGAAGGDR